MSISNQFYTASSECVPYGRRTHDCELRKMSGKYVPYGHRTHDCELRKISGECVPYGRRTHDCELRKMSGEYVPYGRGTHDCKSNVRSTTSPWQQHQNQYLAISSVVACGPLLAVFSDTSSVNGLWWHHKITITDKLLAIAANTIHKTPNPFAIRLFELKGFQTMVLYKKLHARVYRWHNLLKTMAHV